MWSMEKPSLAKHATMLSSGIIKTGSAGANILVSKDFTSWVTLKSSTAFCLLRIYILPLARSKSQSKATMQYSKRHNLKKTTK